MMEVACLLGLYACKAYWQRIVLYAVLYLLGTTVLSRGGLIKGEQDDWQLCTFAV